MPSNPSSADAVVYRNPSTLFDPTGPWSVVAEAGDFVFVAGLRGIDPATNKMVEGESERTRQVFANLRLVAQSVGADLGAVLRLTVFVTDMAAHRPIVNEAQRAFWGDGPYPPRTIVEVSALNQGDFVEVEATLYRPLK